jgi:hypothetical protein
MPESLGGAGAKVYGAARGRHAIARALPILLGVPKRG